MQSLTDLADQAIVLPLIAVIVASLFIQGWWRGAAAWLAVTAATFGLTLALKLIFLGCGGSLGITRIHSPSGHAASAALICGGILARFVSSVPLTLVAATVGAVVIGYTRVVLGFHSLGETVLGGVIGIGGAAALCLIAGPPPRMRTLPLALVIIAVLAALHGKRLPAEPAIREASGLIRLLLPWCQPAAPNPGRPS
jgi:membrane-associated phospholipid phosphatase